MNDEKLEGIIREYIDKSLHLSLATVSGDMPWVCEVHFAYDDNLNLYFRSKTGRRHSQEIALNPHVAGNIVHQHTADEYPQAIYFDGDAELVEDESQFQYLYECFKQRLDVTPDIIEEAKRVDGHKFYKIVAANWYAFGKFGGPSGEKYQLTWNGGQK
ncbi:MAG: pyridoxamine 5'-phosphate oxidase family protein [Candidatus Saccharimonadales bacterium]